MTTHLVSQEEQTLIEEKVKDLLRALQLDVNLDSRIEDGRLYFNISGSEARFFLAGGKDEILKALSFLLVTWHQMQYPESDLDIRVDANHTLFEREKEVRAMANQAIDSLHNPGDEAILEPLNPYERRLVHMALQDDLRLETESLGEGHHKRICIRMKAVPSQT